MILKKQKKVRGLYTIHTHTQSSCERN